MGEVSINLDSNKKRIDYIDILRGLCIILIVWYHTDHPSFLDYPFYNSTLFFVSGMLFNPSDIHTFLKKKFWRLFVPFLFFYVIYYLFLIAINLAKYHTVSYEIYSSIFDVFRWYKENDAYVCNYPLWFIWVLFWLQFATLILTRFIKQPIYLISISLLVSVLGYLYIQHIPTPFILGRSFTFLVYFIAGYLFFTLYNNKDLKTVIIISAAACITAYFIRSHYYMPFISTIIYCIEFVALSVVLLQLCKIIPSKLIRKVLVYFGIKSLIVFGMHDMYLTTLRIATTSIFGNMTLSLGIMNWLLTLLLMIPTIYILNRYFPTFVGKKVVKA